MKRLFIASVGCAVVFLLYPTTRPLLDARLAVTCKVAAIVLLAIMAAWAKRWLLTLALCFSSIGDYVLDIDHLGSLDRQKLFLCGMAAFVVAHLFYISMFLRNRHPKPGVRRLAACVVVVVCSLWCLGLLQLGEMKIPVMAYTGILLVMASTAQLSRFSWMVAVGALSFVASDTLLAMSLFGHPFRDSSALVWITYYAAQATMAWGVSLRATG